MNCRNIILVGFMGAGKSTVGRALAHRLDWDFIDLDARIEAAQGRRIREIFAAEGEEYFRDLETQALGEIGTAQRLVVATGGGVIMRAGNRELLKKLGVTIYLRAGFGTLMERISASDERPLADVREGGNKLKSLLASRTAFYEEADLVIDTDERESPQVVSQILAHLDKKPEKILQEVTVPLGDKSYPILIGGGILNGLGNVLAARGFPNRVALVTNTTVCPLYGVALENSLREAGFECLTIVLPDGEQYKNQKTVNIIYDRLIESHFDRGSALISLGGGVVGDIAGFAAATFMRGIPYAQVPTTLLAQVDSSVGGKTGINHPLGKNLIGAFHQPRLVYIDVETLNTLPTQEYSAGWAEIIKYGMIWDRDFFAWLEQRREELFRKQPEALVEAISRSCRIKARIVGQDEREGGLRAVLNYGHTWGHAVENLAGYGRYRHGEAVAIGMHAAALVSLRKGYCGKADVDRLKQLLKVFHLPLAPPPFGLMEYLEAMKRDKKSHGGVLRFVFNEGIGKYRIEEIPSPETVFRSIWDDLQNE